LVYTSLPLTLTNTHRIATPETLLERARAFDPQALAEIHDTYYPVIHRYVSYRLEDEQTVEDIAAEVFLRLLDNLHRRERDVRDVRAWLFGTANHLVNDALRRKYRKPVEHLDDHETLSGGDSPEQTAELNERQRAVRHAMQFLTIEQQQVLALRFGLECSLEETGKLMKKSVGAIKTLQFRALGALRRHLESRNGE
jgi:RNA polymerase sigma-70 factor, ECF subfamily